MGYQYPRCDSGSIESCFWIYSFPRRLPPIAGLILMTGRLLRSKLPLSEPQRQRGALFPGMTSA
eukprot:1355000-Amorphochlora_amoeboformis.AAC.3